MENIEDLKPDMVIKVLHPLAALYELSLLLVTGNNLVDIDSKC